MTREELVKIIDLLLPVFIDEFGYREKTHEKIADRILAALESEREGEVVLGEGRLISVEPHPCGPTYYACNKNYSGRDGVLTFRPTKAKEAGL